MYDERKKVLSLGCGGPALGSSPAELYGQADALDDAGSHESRHRRTE